jgi:predicted GIY-YIG superfamily endonuclease
MASSQSTTTETVYVYILELACRDRHGRRFYVGQTANVLRRFLEHALGYGAEKTRRYGVKRLVAVYAFPSRHEAKAYEQRCQRLMTQGLWPCEQCCSFLLPASVVALSSTTTTLRLWKRWIKRGHYDQDLYKKVAQGIF